jgi:hypothetical protein
MHTFKLFSSLDTNDKGLDIYKWKMFPYSLVYKVERWYTYSVGSINDSWDKLKDKFCCEFFPYISSRYSTRGYSLFSAKREAVGRQSLD